MVGKSKDNKANKGKKALESEWNEAVAASASGDPLIAASSNRPRGGKGGDSTSAGGIYVGQQAGGSAKQRLRQFEEALSKAGASESEPCKPAGGTGITTEELDETKIKDEKKAKKKAEKEAKDAFEKKQEEDRQKRRLEKEVKEEAERLALLDLKEDS